MSAELASYLQQNLKEMQTIHDQVGDTVRQVNCDTATLIAANPFPAAVSSSSHDVPQDVDAALRETEAKLARLASEGSDVSMGVGPTWHSDSPSSAGPTFHDSVGDHYSLEEEGDQQQQQKQEEQQEQEAEVEEKVPEETHIKPSRHSRRAKLVDDEAEEVSQEEEDEQEEKPPKKPVKPIRKLKIIDDEAEEASSDEDEDDENEQGQVFVKNGNSKRVQLEPAYPIEVAQQFDLRLPDLGAKQQIRSDTWTPPELPSWVGLHALIKTTCEAIKKYQTHKDTVQKALENLKVLYNEICVCNSNEARYRKKLAKSKKDDKDYKLARKKLKRDSIKIKLARLLAKYDSASEEEESSSARNSASDRC